MARTMGATTSRSEQILRDDIATLEASLVATQRPIDFDNEQSATAHSALNTLKNAYYHRQSSRVGRLRSAAVAKFVCTGARSSAAEVRFEPHAMDIDSYQLLPLRCDHKGLQLPKERVPTGMCAPAPPAPPRRRPRWRLGSGSAARPPAPASCRAAAAARRDGGQERRRAALEVSTPLWAATACPPAPGVVAAACT